MDRQYIHDHQVIERYLAGTLTADEEQAFEEAYLEDPVLLDELQAAERLREGLKDVAAGGGLERSRVPKGWLASPQYAAAASVLLAVTVVFSTVMYRENQALREQTLLVDSTVTRFETLETLRGGNEKEIPAPDPAELVLLFVDAGPTRYDSYRGELVRLDGASTQTIWSAGGLEPTSYGAIGIGVVPGRRLTPGSYEASVHARMNTSPPERFDEIARVRFRVVARE